MIDKTTLKGVIAGIAITFIAGSMLMALSGGFDFIATWSEKAENSASRDRVRILETKVAKLPDPSALEEFTNELRQFTTTLADYRSELRSLRERQNAIADSNEKAWARLRYLWDTATQLCTVLEITCATRNAMWGPGDPLPMPDEYALRYAYHKTPALGIYLVKDDPGA